MTVYSLRAPAAHVRFHVSARGRCKLEDAHRAHERLRLFFKAPRRGGGLLDKRGVLLRDLIDLGDGLIDLLHAVALFPAGGGDLAHDRRNALRLRHDLIHGRRGILDKLGPVIDLANRPCDDCLDILRGLGGALGQPPDLAGYDRKTAAAIASPSRLDGCVQRKQVRLERDAVDD